MADIAVWAVPFGLVGGRLYHVITDYQLYFSEGKYWVDAFKIWQGGLGIWGAIALGALGAWIGCRRRGIPLPALADAIAPGIAFAQAHRPLGQLVQPGAVRQADGPAVGAAHHASHGRPATPGYVPPDVPVRVAVVRRRRGPGDLGRPPLQARPRAGLRAVRRRATASGRGWIEYMRVDDAHHILGLRLNDWTAIIVFICAVAFLYLNRAKGDVPEVVEVREGVEVYDLTGVQPAEAETSEAEVSEAQVLEAEAEPDQSPLPKPSPSLSRAGC